MIDHGLLEEFIDRRNYNLEQMTLSEATRKGIQTAFLSHSHKDATLARALQAFLAYKGWTLYIDWQDSTMPTTTNVKTAEKIQDKISTMKWFLYLATANSANSKWCPWELGYADGIKGKRSIVIVPTRDKNGIEHGKEYIGLYKRVSKTKSGGYGMFETNDQGLLLEHVT